MTTTTIYKCFIASPSDTMVEREIIEKVFDEINKGIATIYNFRIESLKWENDVRPTIGTGPQDIINKQIGDDYQIFIGIMFKKFGTPTGKAGSGTEEEFNNAYQRIVNKEDVEIMFYFNEGNVGLKDIVPLQLEKVNQFKSKISELGILGSYNGMLDFESKLRKHLTKFFIEKNNELYDNQPKSTQALIHKEAIRRVLDMRLKESLYGFDGQPIIWIEPILSKTNEISQNPDDNFNKRILIEELLVKPESTIVKAPPQFGLTSLANYLVKEAWERDNLWVYLDSKSTKAHSIHTSVKNEVEKLDEKLENIKCIILDSWNQHEPSAAKKIRNLSDAYKEIPIYVMQSIDDSMFLETESDGDRRLGRNFETLHLLALPRTQIRKVVTEYNNVKNIGDENSLLIKILSDLDSLNIHRTPYNCFTLLKVCEKYFDESPVNRTRMIEMVLFVLFDVQSIPTYKSTPDLKDCEYVLGRFCENMIRNNIYEFSRDTFLKNLSDFSLEKLIDLEVEVVFDVLKANNIIVNTEGSNYHFKSSFWIYYFVRKECIVTKISVILYLVLKNILVFPKLSNFILE